MAILKWLRFKTKVSSTTEEELPHAACSVTHTGLGFTYLRISEKIVKELIREAYMQGVNDALDDVVHKTKRDYDAASADKANSRMTWLKGLIHV